MSRRKQGIAAGLFFRVPGMDPGPAGRAALETEVGIAWGEGAERWQAFQAGVQEAVQAFMATLPDERRALMAPEFLERFPPKWGEVASIVLGNQLQDLLGFARGRYGIGFTIDFEPYIDARGHPAAVVVAELADAARHQRVYRRCARCGAPFSFKRGTAVYCSDACRIGALRERQAQEGGS